MYQLSLLQSGIFNCLIFNDFIKVEVDKNSTNVFLNLSVKKI